VKGGAGMRSTLKHLEESEMKDIIKIKTVTLGDHLVEACDARALHTKLVVKRDFTSWMKGRIEDGGFVEDQDFKVFTQSGENSKGGRPTIEYAITIEMAKHLAMMERNEEGKAVRAYFIERERKLREMEEARKPVTPPRDTTLLDAKRKAQAIDISLNCVDRLLSMFPDLGEAGRRTLVAHLINPIIGAEAIALPRIEKFFTATEIADALGKSAQMIGRVANQLGIKTAEFGQFILGKSQYSDKQVEQFVYNEEGLKRIAEFFDKEAEA
jgi:phage anti-repressor protein